MVFHPREESNSYKNFYFFDHVSAESYLLFSGVCSRIIYNYNFSDRREKIPNIKQNIHESIFDILSNMDKIVPSIESNDEKTRKSIDYILKLGPNTPDIFTDVSKIDKDKFQPYIK